jgi:hypothetical protein
VTVRVSCPIQRRSDLRPVRPPLALFAPAALPARRIHFPARPSPAVPSRPGDPSRAAPPRQPKLSRRAVRSGPCRSIRAFPAGPRRGIPLPLRSAFAVFYDPGGLLLSEPCDVFRSLTPLGLFFPVPRGVPGSWFVAARPVRARRSVRERVSPRRGPGYGGWVCRGSLPVGFVRAAAAYVRPLGVPVRGPVAGLPRRSAARVPGRPDARGSVSRSVATEVAPFRGASPRTGCVRRAVRPSGPSVPSPPRWLSSGRPFAPFGLAGQPLRSGAVTPPRWGRTVPRVLAGSPGGPVARVPPVWPRPSWVSARSVATVTARRAPRSRDALASRSRVSLRVLLRRSRSFRCGSGSGSPGVVLGSVIRALAAVPAPAHLSVLRFRSLALRLAPSAGPFTPFGVLVPTAAPLAARRSVLLAGAARASGPRRGLPLPRLPSCDRVLPLPQAGPIGNGSSGPDGSPRLPVAFRSSPRDPRALPAGSSRNSDRSRLPASRPPVRLPRPEGRVTRPASAAGLEDSC